MGGQEEQSGKRGLLTFYSLLPAPQACTTATRSDLPLPLNSPEVLPASRT